MLTLILNGCATQPVLDTSTVNAAVLPQEVAVEPQSFTGKTVQWGGKIVEITNRESVTQLQILSYPVNQNGEIQAGQKPTGRFLLIHGDFLEPLDYAPGRWITVVGRVSQITTEAVGETMHQIPTLENTTLHLWRHDPSRPRVYPHFGIGIGIGL